MDGPGARPHHPDRRARPAIAWTAAAAALLIAVAAFSGRGSGAGGGLWMSADPVLTDPTTPPSPGVTTVPTSGSSGSTDGDGTDGNGKGTDETVADGGDAVPAPSTTTSTEAPAPPGTSPDNPPIVARPVPAATTPPPPAVAPPPWASSVRTTDEGYVTTDAGCARDTTAEGLDAFFHDRLGPVIGEDYQHVVDLGDGRALWLFQDTFVDPGGTATRLDQAAFVHNVAMVQHGACFTLFTRGAPDAPASFEPGDGERSLRHWYWPMGGETVDGRVYQFWVKMVKDAYEPGPGDGLGWHPDSVWLAVYDASTLARLWFGPAADPGVAPVYGYAVVSDATHTYLFGNSFEQNLVREGGYFAGPHSATRVFLARVPRGQFIAAPEYRTADGWSPDASAAVPVSTRYWVENPMQPRYLAGRWIAVTKVDGYWGEELSVDVAPDPWGPWTNVSHEPLLPRDGDPLMNTYHAHLMPWLGDGALVVSVSQNARDMVRDAYPHPVRYRPRLFTVPLPELPVPPDTVPPDTTTTTVPPTSTTTTTTTTTTTVPPTSSTTTTTTVPPTSSTTTTTTTTTTTRPPDPTTTTTSTTTTTVPDDTTTTSAPEEDDAAEFVERLDPAAGDTAAPHTPAGPTG